MNIEDLYEIGEAIGVKEDSVQEGLRRATDGYSCYFHYDGSRDFSLEEISIIFSLAIPIQNKKDFELPHESHLLKKYNPRWTTDFGP